MATRPNKDNFTFNGTTYPDARAAANQLLPQALYFQRHTNIRDVFEESRDTNESEQFRLSLFEPSDTDNEILKAESSMRSKSRYGLSDEQRLAKLKEATLKAIKQSERNYGNTIKDHQIVDVTISLYVDTDYDDDKEITNANVYYVVVENGDQINGRIKAAEKRAKTEFDKKQKAFAKKKAELERAQAELNVLKPFVESQ